MMMAQNNIPQMYLGDRNDKFKQFIISTLNKGKLHKKYIEMLTTEDSIKLYMDAFTSDEVDPENNYQIFEQMGDSTGNKFIVTYMYNRFPYLRCVDGVKIIARLKINYGSKQTFSGIAHSLGFWPFISATTDLRQRKMKSLLEDVFEAFIGVTEHILDTKSRIGVGYAIVYQLLSRIFDDMNISLKYNDLYDAKTRLKELFDTYGNDLGKLIYEDICPPLQKDNKDLNRVSKCIIYHQKSSKIKLGEGTASLKADAQQIAANKSLEILNSQGWIKPIPDFYNKINNDDKHQEEHNDFNELINNANKDNINELLPTKKKTKYQNKYKSTLYAYFCRIRNYDGVKKCLELNCDINIPDTDNIYAIELLLMGKEDQENVNKILEIIKTSNKFSIIHRHIYDYYKKMYTSMKVELID